MNFFRIGQRLAQDIDAESFAPRGPENDCLLARDCCRSYRNIACNRMWDDDAALMVGMDNLTGRIRGRDETLVLENLSGAMIQDAGFM